MQKNEPSPKIVDVLTLLGLESIRQTNTCTIIALDGSSTNFRVIYLTNEEKQVPQLNGNGSIFLRAKLNVGESLEVRSTSTNLDSIKLGYFVGETCLFDSRESANKSLSNVRPVGTTDFTTTTNTANFQAFRTSTTGYYNIKLEIGADPSQIFNDIKVNYK